MASKEAAPRLDTTENAATPRSSSPTGEHDSPGLQEETEHDEGNESVQEGDGEAEVAEQEEEGAKPVEEDAWQAVFSPELVHSSFLSLSPSNLNSQGPTIQSKCMVFLELENESNNLGEPETIDNRNFFYLHDRTERSIYFYLCSTTTTRGVSAGGRSTAYRPRSSLVGSFSRERK
jgi:hypothetical protein